MARSVGRQIGLPIVGLAFHLMIHGTELPEPEEQQGACHRTEDDTRDATPGDGIGAIGVIPTLEKVDWCLRKEEKSGVNFQLVMFMEDWTRPARATRSTEQQDSTYHGCVVVGVNVLY
ncbi:hypothetical protein BO82DRAFT_358914 [Aspergillus uvarum CBS 121591]|uniref:Uncharacterized protein n=1 Tax=Aspergillus uvarum CBS 121591 TaxID=1448315 RepID=A0A319BYJ7_9EURO|nr:hypothetical protein BO82DRAFT_358914 [Aspergillus uvarum CBS 121591]PYH76679.1 hypothetical protein BO82DRAFT_358914 [Aspergillus uvarum CBS 121591]